MSKFKIEFTLKQHTQLIHFQSDQSGATLRATELKPKFDRFLIEQLSLTEMIKKDNKDIEVPKDKYKHWFIGEGKKHLALDYKVKIVAKNSTKLQYKTYIATRDRDNKALKVGSYFGDFKALKSSIIKIEFFCFNPKVIDYINQYFNEFISTHTFGTRTSKGFGNYTNEKTTQKQFEEYLKKHFILFKKISEREPLQKILKEYQVLKSGARGGVKSKLMTYFIEDNIRWEKRWIKRKLKEKKEEWFNDLKDEYHTNDNAFHFSDSESYIFTRALLGLAEHNEFLVNSNSSDKLIVKISNDDIERFSSPLVYKIFDNTIYVLLDKKMPINPKIFNKKFKFIAYYKNNKKTKVSLGALKTPNFFDIANFLKKVL